MSRSDPPPIVVECTIRRETERAMLIETASGEEMWIPLSQVTRTVRAAPNTSDLDEVHMSAWIAGQKGLV